MKLKQLKSELLSGLRKGFFTSVFFVLFLSIYAVFAISWPPSSPSGSVPGGKFMDYFNKILVDTSDLSDGTVKKSDDSNKLGGLPFNSFLTNNAFVIKNSCTWTPYLNSMDGVLSYECPNNGVIAGLDSYHNNGTEDRRWRVRCCELRVNTVNISQPNFCEYNGSNRAPGYKHSYSSWGACITGGCGNFDCGNLSGTQSRTYYECQSNGEYLVKSESRACVDYNTYCHNYCGQGG